jgi:hypothetical protein
MANSQALKVSEKDTCSAAVPAGSLAWAALSAKAGSSASAETCTSTSSTTSAALFHRTKELNPSPEMERLRSWRSLTGRKTYSDPPGISAPIVPFGA